MRDRFRLLIVSFAVLVSAASSTSVPVPQSGPPPGMSYEQYYGPMCADPQPAYQNGYEAGYQHKQLDTSWTRFCAPQVQQQAAATWFQGYQAGASAAPPPPQRVVVTTRPGVAYVGSSVQRCTFSSDCGDPSDYSCRNWRGQNVCMGMGGSGDPCWFSSDCLSESCSIDKTCQ